MELRTTWSWHWDDQLQKFSALCAVVIGMRFVNNTVPSLRALQYSLLRFQLVKLQKSTDLALRTDKRKMIGAKVTNWAVRSNTEFIF
jgi:hypothetical protein